MELSETDRDLIAALQDGLPLAPRPYAVLGAELGLSEADVIRRLRDLSDQGTIRRFGVVVRHLELGYRANAMVVWALLPEELDDTGRRLAGLPYVSLCYQRPPRPPAWPYNLFCMIHGRRRHVVEALIENATEAAGLVGRPRAVLFSRRRFKQRGARYESPQRAEAVA